MTGFYEYAGFQRRDQNSGRIELILGPMFSGKTTELIKRVNRDRVAGLEVVAIKSQIDSRYAETENHKSFIVCHSGAKMVGWLKLDCCPWGFLQILAVTLVLASQN